MLIGESDLPSCYSYYLLIREDKSPRTRPVPSVVDNPDNYDIPEISENPDNTEVPPLVFDPSM